MRPAVFARRNDCRVWCARGLQQKLALPNHAGWNDAPEAMMPAQPWIMTHSRRRSQSGGALSEFWRSLKIYSPATTFLFSHQFICRARSSRCPETGTLQVHGLGKNARNQAVADSTALGDRMSWREKMECKWEL